MLVNSFPPYQYFRPCCYPTTTVTPVLVFVPDATSVASTKSIKARKRCIVFHIYLTTYHFLVVLVVFINLSQEGHHLDVQDLIRSSPASILDSWFLLDGDWSEFLEQGPIHVNTFKFQTTKPISEVCRSMCICHSHSWSGSNSQLLSGLQYDFPMPKVIDINTRPDTTVTARPVFRGQAVSFREWRSVGPGCLEFSCLKPLPQAAKLARLNPGGADSDKLVPMAANDGGTGCSRYQWNKQKRITNAYIWD